MRNTNVILILLIFLIVGCVHEMSLEDAKEVLRASYVKSFVPPPRKIDDILDLLNQTDQDHTKMNIQKKEMAKNPPDTDDPATLAKFYYDRGNNTWSLGYFPKGLEDWRNALTFAEEARISKNYSYSRQKYLWLLVMIGNAEGLAGDFIKGLKYSEKTISLASGGDMHSWFYINLLRLYIRSGDIKSAESLAAEGVQFCDNKINLSMGSERNKESEKDKHSILARILEAKGQHKEAEKHWRLALEYYELRLGVSLGSVDIHKINNYIWFKESLVRNLSHQGKRIEAEYLGRELLKETITYYGVNTPKTTEAISALGEVFLSSGRLRDAEKLALYQIKILKQSGIADDSRMMGEARVFHIEVLTAMKNFDDASKIFFQLKNNMQENQYLINKYFKRNNNVISSLVGSGHLEEVKDVISQNLKLYKNQVGIDNYLTAEMAGYSGILHYIQNDFSTALEDFQLAVPVLSSEIESGKINYLMKQRFSAILENYLNLLSDIHENGLEKKHNIDTIKESIQVYQTLLGNTVQDDLLFASARRSVSDPQLKDLIRQNQDNVKLINSLEIHLLNSLTASDSKSVENATAIQNEISLLKSARETLQSEIQKKFPRYSNLIHTNKIVVTKAQNYLRTGETIICIYTGQKKSYIWALPNKGVPLFKAVNIDLTRTNQIVRDIRNAMNFKFIYNEKVQKTFYKQAFNLHKILLKPVAPALRNATDLIITVHGPLAQIPFSLIPTSNVSVNLTSKNNFSDYLKIPWLIQQMSITYTPSLSSFVSLRSLPKEKMKRKEFLGFGDPIFSKMQMAGTQTSYKGLQDRQMHVRGLRLTKQGDLDRENIKSNQLEQLRRLPDTAEEVKSIASALGANISNDVFLQDRASEKNVKTMNLANRKVLVFASHALIPGDIDGLNQPAIALSSPSVTGNSEDGLLTMGEVLKLKMNSDWVVLSGCNTGAAEGAGAEAISGLGRAFFYAGTRAILVSMWPVETTSTTILTSGIFITAKQNEQHSKANALQQSILSLMKKQATLKSDRGPFQLNYSHPIFWAPFIVVGDGR